MRERESEGERERGSSHVATTLLIQGEMRWSNESEGRGAFPLFELPSVIVGKSRSITAWYWTKYKIPLRDICKKAEKKIPCVMFRNTRQQSHRNLSSRYV